MDGAGGNAPASVSSRRKWVFRLIGVSLSLTPLLLGEVACRLRGYGGLPPVLREIGTIDGRTYVVADREGVKSFFFTGVGGLCQGHFTMPKDPGTVRVFMLGGSAMQGYPQPRHLASSAFLQAMLSDLWPDKTVEVLNLGTVAIASFPVMCIADEALRYDPDLLILYSGNNEFYGANGVASVHRFGRSTRAMRILHQVRRSALVQWLLEQRVRRGDQPQGQRILMEAVMADAQIGPDDPRRFEAARNLKNHLTRIIENCQRKGVPVIVCTLPANERDLAPIGEDIAPPLSDAQRARFDDLLAAGQRLMSSHPKAALRKLTSAASLYDCHATLHFLIAKCLTALGRHEEASRAYTRAKDLDTMPWRAPSAFNDVVRQAAKRGAVLCDLERAFRGQSPGGAIGLELMDDHVHPTLRGQAVIAMALLRSMGELPSPLRVDTGRVVALPSWSVYAQRLGANMFDRYRVANLVASVHGAPFLRRSNPELLRRFASRCGDLESRMSAVERRAVREWERKFPRLPITGVVGLRLLAAGAHAEASALLSVARRDVGRYSLWHLHYSSSALEARRRLPGELSESDLALAREIIETGEVVGKFVSPDAPLVEVFVGCACNLLGMHEQAIRHLRRAVRKAKKTADADAVVSPLVDSLVLAGRGKETRRVLQDLAADPELRGPCARLLRGLGARPGSITDGGESPP